MKELKWYAVYTRPKWEKKVTELLTKKKITAYYPLNKVYRHWSEGRRIFYEPLFASYVFVRLNETDYANVLQTSGVVSFVYWLDRPAIIQDEEIDTIKHFLNEYSNVTLEKSPVSLNEEVKIISGPLILRKGNLLEVLNNTLKVTLSSLGYILVAEVRKENSESRTYVEESRLKV
ncbi:MAG: UpxY family transcription antiterminator [Bacteroidota bacterium]